MEDPGDIKNSEENDSPSQVATNPTDKKRRLSMVGLFVVVGMLFIAILSIVIFLVRDDSGHNTIKQGAIENKQLPFVQQVHFPNTSRFNIKPDQESTSSFIVRDDKGLSIYDASIGSIDSISLYDVVPNLKLGDYTKVGKLVFFGTGEGIGVYDLDTDEIQIYNTQDGLADKSNIRFHPDPYDSNTVWIGTFRGLSRFDLSNRTFQSYTREIGIPGTVWQPHVFYIDQNTVWVTVAANAYNTGGVARLNKTTGVWTAWGTETFVADGEINSRVDPVYASVGSERYIIIEEDDTEYVFDREQQTWSELRSFERGESTARGLHLNGDWYFYNKQQELHAYNVVTRESLSIDYTEIFNNAAGTDVRTVDIRYDEIHNRYLLRPSSGVFVEHPYIVTFRVVDGVAKDIEPFSFADIYDRYQYTDVQILDVDGNEIVMRTRDSVVLYDLQQQRSIFTLNNTDLLADGFDIKVKLYPTTVGIHVAEYCDGMCVDDSGYRATTTVWNRETGQLELADSFDSTTSGWRMIWDEESFGVTLHHSYTEEPQSFILNLTNRAYQETTQHPQFDDRYIDYGEFVPVESSSDVQYVKRNIKEDRNILKVKTISSDGTEETHRITLPMLVNAFGVNPGYDVTDAVLHEYMVWFLTDRGLVRFDLETKQWNIYSSEDGLTQDTGSQLYITGDQFIIVNSLGIGIYQYTGKLN